MKKAFLFVALLIIGGCSSTRDISNVDISESDLLAGERLLKIQIVAPGIKAEGSGSWISNDLVITASHLFSDMPLDSIVRVGNGRHWLSAKVVAGNDPATLDLVVLRVIGDESVASPLKTLIPVCSKPVKPGEMVSVSSALPKGTTYTYGSPNFAVQADSERRESTEFLTGFYDKGTSGGPVYQVPGGCLAGVISLGIKRKNGASDIYATKFVTAHEIKRFLDDNKITY
ncbi:trypsin-like peptidase domain-containing protein [Pseudomonas rossensis]|uniref:trypsin-like peptidase domain-containing protein n=1 Tax=Pseudomonas rossensis TaxID=2305471 RepID=UPI00326108B9